MYLMMTHIMIQISINEIGYWHQISNTKWYVTNYTVHVPMLTKHKGINYEHAHFLLDEQRC